MIEPQSAQLGASAWALKVTWLRPMPRLPRVTRGLPLPFPLPLELGEEVVGEAPAEAELEPALALGPEDSLAGGCEAGSEPGAATAVAGEEAGPSGLSDEAALLPPNPEAGSAAPGFAAPRGPGATSDSAVSAKTEAQGLSRRFRGRRAVD